jgi:hypothetical protein
MYFYLNYLFTTTALPAAIRYILKAESDDRRGARRKIYRIRAGSAKVLTQSEIQLIFSDGLDNDRDRTSNDTTAKQPQDGSGI